MKGVLAWAVVVLLPGCGSPELMLKVREAPEVTEDLEALRVQVRQDSAAPLHDEVLSLAGRSLPWRVFGLALLEARYGEIARVHAVVPFDSTREEATAEHDPTTIVTSRARLCAVTTFFRAMLSGGDTLPLLGDQKNSLGVRPGFDVASATAGPGRGGMSVTADEPHRMPPGVLPKAFGGLNPETIMFQTPQATFGPASGLAVGPTGRNKHAVVEARVECPIGEFQTLLANTRPSWALTQLPTGAATP